MHGTYAKTARWSPVAGRPSGPADWLLWMYRSVVSMRRFLLARKSPVVIGATLGLGLLLAGRAHSLELTGALAYKFTMDGRVGPFWHTASGLDGRPLGVLEQPPWAARVARLENIEDGVIDKELQPGPHVMILFWQEVPGEWPLVGMVLNLYFNGDALEPGISVIVTPGPAFTGFYANVFPTTFSLYLREIQNQGALSFDDGTLQARLDVAFYMASTGVTDLWRPTDLTNIDRVGLKEFRPDGKFDNLLVIELTVTASGQAPGPVAPLQPDTRSGGAVIGPLVARPGADRWVGPPTPAPLVEPSAPPGRSGSAGRSTPGATDLEGQEPAIPTPAPSHTDLTPVATTPRGEVSSDTRTPERSRAPGSRTRTIGATAATPQTTPTPVASHHGTATATTPTASRRSGKRRGAD